MKAFGDVSGCMVHYDSALCFEMYCAGSTTCTCACAQEYGRL